MYFGISKFTCEFLNQKMEANKYSSCCSFCIAFNKRNSLFKSLSNHHYLFQVIGGIRDIRSPQFFANQLAVENSDI